MATEQPTNPELTRRQLMRGAATAGAGAITFRAADDLGLDPDPVGEADAIAPIVVAGIAGGSALAGAATGWALRETEVIGSDDPPEGLTADALHLKVYETANARESTLKSTYVDNLNLIEGAKNVAYSEGKLAAIQAINNQKTESEVTSAATQAANAHWATVQKNFLKSWREAVLEYEKFMATVVGHPELTRSINDNGSGKEVHAYTSEGETRINRDIELADGSTYRIPYLGHPSVDDAWNPLQQTGSNPCQITHPSKSEKTDYLDHDQSNSVWSKIDTAVTNTSDGLIKWVQNVYGEVQAGELDPDNLFSPAELARLSADSGVDKAIADLMALNVAVELEREAEIYLPNKGATIYGQLGYTGSGELSTGTVDPTADSESYYLTYDISRGEGTWSAYETAVDGGTVTFTSEPYPKSQYRIKTVAGETVDITTSALSETDAGGAWEVDISDQLDDAITEIAEVRYYAQTDETQYETIQLENTFEIKSFTDPEGNKHDTTSFTKSEPQTDDNYVTKEEWQDLKEQNEKLIERYKEAKNDDGGLFSDGSNGLFGGFFSNMRNVALAGGAVIAGLFGINAATS